MPSGIARKLHRRCVCQVLSLPAYRRLDQTAEECAGKTNDHQSDRQGQYAAPTFITTAPVTRKRGGIQIGSNR